MAKVTSGEITSFVNSVPQLETDTCCETEWAENDIDGIRLFLGT